MANTFDFTSQTIAGNEEARRQRQEFEQQFLSGFTVPERATSAILNTRRNRFGIADLEQNFDTNLDTSRNEALLQNRQSQTALENFDEVEGLSALEREIAAEDGKSRLEKLGTDRAFNTLLDEMAPIRETAAKHDYYDQFFAKIDESGADESVKRGMRAKAKAQFAKDLAPQLRFFENAQKSLEKFDRALSNGTPEDQRNAFETLATILQKVDKDLLDTAIAQGVLAVDDLDPKIMSALSAITTEGSLDIQPVDETDQLAPAPQEELQPETQSDEVITPVDDQGNVVLSANEVFTDTDTASFFEAIRPEDAQTAMRFLSNEELVPPQERDALGGFLALPVEEFVDSTPEEMEAILNYASTFVATIPFSEIEFMILMENKLTELVTLYQEETEGSEETSDEEEKPLTPGQSRQRSRRGNN